MQLSRFCEQLQLSNLSLFKAFHCLRFFQFFRAPLLTAGSSLLSVGAPSLTFITLVRMLRLLFNVEI